MNIDLEIINLYLELSYDNPLQVVIAVIIMDCKLL